MKPDQPLAPSARHPEYDPVRARITTNENLHVYALYVTVAILGLGLQATLRFYYGQN
jgi:hypothetical protein